MESWRAGLATAAWVTMLAACGGPATTPPTQADREWNANAAGVIDQLHHDLALAASGGDTVPAARLALGNVSSLYTILVAYTDFGGCRHMVAAAGATPARYARVRATLGGACRLLERAAALFTRATTRRDARALVAAGRTIARAAPLLVRARAELGAATPRRDRG